MQKPACGAAIQPPPFLCLSTFSRVLGRRFGSWVRLLGRLFPRASRVLCLRIICISSAAISGFVYCQGFNILTPLGLKSASFRVTMVRLCSSAVAAIRESIIGSGRPFVSRSALRSPQRYAVEMSNDNIRRSNLSTTDSSQPLNSLARLAVPSFAMPFLISAIARTLI